MNDKGIDPKIADGVPAQESGKKKKNSDKPPLQRFFESLVAFVGKSEYRYLFFTYLIIGTVCLTAYLIANKGNLSELGISMLKDFAVNSLVFIITTYVIGTTIVATREKEHEQAKDRLLKELRALEDYQRFTESGLVAIYPHKDPELNRVTNPKYSMVHQMDFLTAGGLSGLLKAPGQNGQTLKENFEDLLLDHGLHIRILTLASNSDYLIDAAMLESHAFFRCGEGQGYCDAIANSGKYDRYFATLSENAKKEREKIKDLGDWCEKVQKRIEAGEGRNPGRIEIRYYNSMPLLNYQRIDNDIFISHERHGAKSQQVEAIHYIRGDKLTPSEPYERYTRYFDDLWNDAQFSSKSNVAQISPVRLIADMYLLELLNNCSRSMAHAIYKSLPDEKRENVRPGLFCGHIVSYLSYVDEKGDSLMLMGATGNCNEGRVENRYADATMLRRYKPCTKDNVLNKAIQTKQTQFKFLSGDNEEDKERCAVLAVPLYDPQGRISIVLSIDFNKELDKEVLRRIMADERSKQALLMCMGGFATTVATYLHLICKVEEEAVVSDELQAV